MTSDDRGYLAAAASRFSLWWHGDRRPPALTADTASGAGLQGGNDDDVPQSNGDANLAPSEGRNPDTPPNQASKTSRSSSLNRRNHCWPNKRNRNETWGGPSELSGARQADRCLYGAGEPSWA